jgi:hypothetical protein
MRQIRVGDKVRAFLDSNICGEVTEILYRPARGGMLMVGGVPPVEAYAKILMADGKSATVKTTELSHESL